MIIYVWIICLLFLSFLLAFGKMKWLKIVKKLLYRTKDGMDRAARVRALETRHQLMELQRKNTLWYRLEEFLSYSGVHRRFPYCTAEIWITGNLLVMALLFFSWLAVSGEFRKAVIVALLFSAGEYLTMNMLRFREMRSVNDNLLKCLNFMGNYSLTAGEITTVLGQVSRYMEEPLRGVMEECAYEAQTTGDHSLALLTMADRIEHPKFKELARNLEISIRYMTDLTALIDSSRKSVREYLRMEEERKGLLREAMINMGLLMAMSLFSLLTVDRLIDTSVWNLLFYSIPGHLAIGLCVLIFFLFLQKIYGFRR